MSYLNAFLNYAPNYMVAIVFAAIGAIMSVLVAMLARKLIPFEFDGEASGLADKVHSSLIGFAVLVMAFAIGEARGNLSKATDAVSLEAFQIRQLDRQLMSYGAAATLVPRAQLLGYANSVVADEWPQLSGLNPTESTKTRKQLAALSKEIRDLQPTTKVQESLKPALENGVDQLEKSHDGLIDKANNQVPGLFWAMIVALVAIGMVFNVRYKPTKLNYVLIAAHMAAIGVAIAFLAMLDDPFRGETSVPPDLISHEITKLSAYQQ
jgi:ABC-type multidrug transport system fused ATPase/permease subunit